MWLPPAGYRDTPGRPDREVPRPTAIVVEPAVETEPVSTYGDAADDPAIWVNPRDPAQSLIIGANKKLGLEVYDLAGRRIQTLPDGRMNNVDLRDGFPFDGEGVYAGRGQQPHQQDASRCTCSRRRRDG